MTTARNEILALVTRHRPIPLPLPAVEGTWLRPESRVSYFCDMVASVGGHVVAIPSIQDVSCVIEQDARYLAAERVCSLFRSMASRGITDTAIEVLNGECPLDVTIAASNIAVAENAAVYLEPGTRKEHALLFLCEHLFIVVRSDAVVDNMHQAYDRICASASPIAATGAGPGFGIFISGPSKTADIEQALVIGAQGPRSLTVFLVP